MAHAVKWIEADPDEPVVDVAKRSLQARLEPVQYYLPLAAKKSDEDIEHVHDVRVWSRRAQAAIEMYWELLPEWRAAWIDKQLKRIRGASNDARDDDVFARRLKQDKDTPAAAQLLKRVQANRVEAQNPIRSVYDRLRRKNRFDRKIARLLNRVRLRGKKLKSKKPRFGQWAPAHLRPVLDEFFESADADLSKVEQLHQFRIDGKKLRYALELLAGAFPVNIRQDIYPNLETLQDQLGTINDHAAARARIRRWIEEADGDRNEIEYLNEMLSHEQTLLEQSYNEFNEWWTAKRRNKLQEKFDEVIAIKV